MYMMLKFTAQIIYTRITFFKIVLYYIEVKIFAILHFLNGPPKKKNKNCCAVTSSMFFYPKHRFNVGLEILNYVLTLRLILACDTKNINCSAFAIPCLYQEWKGHASHL